MTDGASHESKVQGLSADEAGHRAQVQALIAERRTMVLSTCGADAPWAAPVYYVYRAPGFYFFSSPRSRHIQQGLSNRLTAAAIFADSAQWEDIQGIQMAGVLQEVTRLFEQAGVVGRFLWKFPFARPFLQSGSQEAGNPPKLVDKVRLYRFVPHEIHFTNNRSGFGQRIAVTLEG
ncbi:MAG: pyridoxamine 5'-phosphate oxidase family protein [Desulfatitalea sp.]|nr:pyridoxamine 5'-phosphate oxidase family protein [Desulfatitalea sp.]